MNTNTNLGSENTDEAVESAATAAAAAQSGMGGSPMQGAPERILQANGETLSRANADAGRAPNRGMGGSPMRGAPERILQANGETRTGANADAGRAQVAVSGTPQTHGRAAHATAAATAAGKGANADAGRTRVAVSGTPQTHGRAAHATAAADDDAGGVNGGSFRTGEPPVPLPPPLSPPLHGRDARAASAAVTVGAGEDFALNIRRGACLPHWSRRGGAAVYAVTFRLADSMPADVLAGWKFEREDIVARIRQQGREPTVHEKERLDELYSQRIEDYLNAGHGACHLRDPRVAEMVAENLRHFDGVRYRLLAWCVMPNHVHLLLCPISPHELPNILHSLKSYTAHRANEILRREGTFWQSEAYDHLIRDEDDFLHALHYIEQNPVKAGLVNWPWCATENGKTFYTENYNMNTNTETNTGMNTDTNSGMNIMRGKNNAEDNSTAESGMPESGMAQSGMGGSPMQGAPNRGMGGSPMNEWHGRLARGGAPERILQANGETLSRANADAGRTPESGMGGSPMRGAPERILQANGETLSRANADAGRAPNRGMGGSPMQGAPERILQANGETLSRANADAGRARVAVSGTPQTHGRAAHATAGKARFARAALFAAAAMGVGIGAEFWNSLGVESGMGGSPMRGAPERILQANGEAWTGANADAGWAPNRGMGGSPMRGAPDGISQANGEALSRANADAGWAPNRGMGGSPMRGAPERILQANGETLSCANADAGWAQVAVSGTSQTHGRAAHATKAWTGANADAGWAQVAVSGTSQTHGRAAHATMAATTAAAGRKSRGAWWSAASAQAAPGDAWAKEWGGEKQTVSVGFGGGKAFTVGSPGAVQVAAANWNYAGLNTQWRPDYSEWNYVPGSVTTGTVHEGTLNVLKNDSGSVVANIGVEWNSGGDREWASGAGWDDGTDTAQGQLTKSFLGGIERGDTLGWGVAGTQIKFTGLAGLGADEFAVYVIRVGLPTTDPNDGLFGGLAAPIWVNGNYWTSTEAGKTVLGNSTSTWASVPHVYSNGPLAQGLGGSYLKIPVLPSQLVSGGEIRIVSGKVGLNGRSNIAGVQIEWGGGYEGAFNVWNPTLTAQTNWNTSNWLPQTSPTGTPSTWQGSGSNAIAVFDPVWGSQASNTAYNVAIDSTYTVDGIWVRSGKVTLSQTGGGSIALSSKGRIALEAGATLVLGASVTLDNLAVVNSTPTSTLSINHTTKGISIGTMSGGTLDVGAGARADLASSTGALTKTGAGLLNFTSAGAVMNLTVAGGTVLGAAQAVGTGADAAAGSITFKTGGTYRLSASGGDNIRDTTALIFDGGTLDLAGLNEVIALPSGTGIITNSRHTSPVSGGGNSWSGTNNPSTLTFVHANATGSREIGVNLTGDFKQVIIGYYNNTTSGTLPINTIVLTGDNSSLKTADAGIANMTTGGIAIYNRTTLEFSEQKNIGDNDIVMWWGAIRYTGTDPVSIGGLALQNSGEEGDYIYITNPNAKVTLKQYNGMTGGSNRRSLKLVGPGTLEIASGATDATKVNSAAPARVYGGTLLLNATLRADGSSHAIFSNGENEDGTTPGIGQAAALQLLAPGELGGLAGVGDSNPLVKIADFANREGKVATGAPIDNAAGNQISVGSVVRVNVGTLDLNGNDERFSKLTSSSTSTTGNVTNSNNAYLATLTLGSRSNDTAEYYGSLTGNIYLKKEGGQAQTFWGPVLLTGAGAGMEIASGSSGGIIINTTAETNPQNILGKLTLNDRQINLAGTAGALITDFGTNTAGAIIDMYNVLNSKPLEIRVEDGKTIKYEGQIRGGNASGGAVSSRPLHKTGAGRLILTNTASVFGGPVRILEGTLEVPNWGTTDGNQSTPIGYLNKQWTDTNAKELYIAAGAVFDVTSTNTGTRKYTFKMVGDEAGIVNLAVGARITDFGPTGTVAGFTKTGPGTLHFGGEVGNHGGPNTTLTVAGGPVAWSLPDRQFHGTVILENDGAFFAQDGNKFESTNFIFNGEATKLVLRGRDRTLKSISGTGGTITNSGKGDMGVTLPPTDKALDANATLTVNFAAADGVKDFGGNIVNGPTYTLAFTKNGTGTQILSGDNDYSGRTDVKGGTLILSGTTNTGTGNVYVDAGATLVISGTQKGTYVGTDSDGKQADKSSLQSQTTGTILISGTSSFNQVNFGSGGNGLMTITPTGSLTVTKQICVWGKLYIQGELITTLPAEGVLTGSSGYLEYSGTGHGGVVGFNQGTFVINGSGAPDVAMSNRTRTELDILRFNNGGGVMTFGAEGLLHTPTLESLRTSAIPVTLTALFPKIAAARVAAGTETKFTLVEVDNAWTGSAATSTTFSVQGSGYRTGALTVAKDGNNIVAVVKDFGLDLTWKNTGGASNDWKYDGTPQNWTRDLGGAADAFYTGDSVTFDLNTSSGFSSRTVTVGASLIPSNVTVKGGTSAEVLTLSGSPLLAQGAFVKEGQGKLVLNNGANSFPSVLLKEGVTVIHNKGSLGAGRALVTFGDGAELRMTGSSQEDEGLSIMNTLTIPHGETARVMTDNGTSNYVVHLRFANFGDTGTAGKFQFAAGNLATGAISGTSGFSIFGPGSPDFAGTLEVDSPSVFEIKTLSGQFLNFANATFSTGVNANAATSEFRFTNAQDGTLGATRPVLVKEFSNLHSGKITTWRGHLDVISGKISRANDAANDVFVIKDWLNTTENNSGGGDLTSTSGTLTFDTGAKPAATIEVQTKIASPSIVDASKGEKVNVVKDGAGILKFSLRQQAKIGDITVNAGTLDWAIAETLSAAKVDVRRGATLKLSEGDVHLTNSPLTVLGGTLASADTGTSGHTLGTVTLAGAAIASGSGASAWKLREITVNPLADGEGGEGGAPGARTLTTATGALANGGIQLGANSVGGATFAVNTGAVFYSELVLSDAEGAAAGTSTLTKTGAGELVLGSANTYTGKTFVKAGTLTIAGAQVPVVTGGYEVGAAGTDNAGVSLKITAGADLEADAGMYLAAASSAGALASGATVKLHEGASLVLDHNGGFNATLAGTDNAGALDGGVRKTGGGTSTLTTLGAGAHHGATVVADGTLAITVAAAVAASTGVELTSDTAIFDISGVDAATSIKALTATVGGTDFTVAMVNLGGKTLSVGVADAGVANDTATYAGKITGANGTFIKTGLGKLLLSGVNTHGASGAPSTQVHQGTLAFTAADALGATGAKVELRDNTTLQWWTGAGAAASGSELDLAGRIALNGTASRATFDFGSYLLTPAAMTNAAVLGDIGGAAGTTLVAVNAGALGAGGYAGNLIVVNPGLKLEDLATATPEQLLGQKQTAITIGAGKTVGTLTNAYDLRVSGGIGTATINQFNSSNLANTALTVRFADDASGSDNDQYVLGNLAAGAVTVGGGNEIRLTIPASYLIGDIAANGGVIERTITVATADGDFSGFLPSQFKVFFNGETATTFNPAQAVAPRYNSGAKEIQLNFVNAYGDYFWTGEESGTARDKWLKGDTLYNWTTGALNIEINFEDWRNVFFDTGTVRGVGDTSASRVVAMTESENVSSMTITGGAGWVFNGAADLKITGATGKQPSNSTSGELVINNDDAAFGDATSATFNVGVDFAGIAVADGAAARFNSGLKSAAAVAVSDGAVLTLGMLNGAAAGQGLDASTGFALDGATLATPAAPATAGTLTLGASNTVTVDNAATFDVAHADSTLVVSTAIAAAAAPADASIVKTGAGTLVLGGSTSTFAGGVTLSGGTLEFGAIGALGADATANKLVLNSPAATAATLHYTGVSDLDFAGRVEMTAGAGARLEFADADTTLELGAIGGSANLASELVNVAPVGTAGALVKISSFAGKISGGRWSVLDGSSVGAGAANTEYSVHGSAATGSVTLGSLSTFAGVTLNVRLDSNGSDSDKYALGGTTTFGLGNSIRLDRWQPGTFTLATGTFSNPADATNAANITFLNNETADGLFDAHQGRKVTASVSALKLTLTDRNAVVVWTGAAADWAVAAAAATPDAHWTPAGGQNYESSLNTYFTNRDIARFDASGTAESAVTVTGGGVTVADMHVFADYAFSGGAITGTAVGTVDNPAAAGKLFVAGVTVEPGDKMTDADTLAYAAAAPANVSFASALTFAGASVVNATVTLASTATLNTGASANTVLVGAGGVLSVSGANPLSGGNLTLSKAAPGALADGTVLADGSTLAGLAGGIFRTTGTGNVSLANNLPVNLDGEGTFDVTGAGQTLSVAGLLTAIGTADATVLRKTGAGTLSLGSASPAFTGKTEVHAGRLVLANINALGTTNNSTLGSISIAAAGTLELAPDSAGSATFTKRLNAVTDGAGRFTLAPAAAGAAFTLTLNGTNAAFNGTLEVLGDNAVMAAGATTAIGFANLALGGSTQGGTFAFTSSMNLGRDSGDAAVTAANAARKITPGASGLGAVSVAGGQSVTFSGQLVAEGDAAAKAAAALTKAGAGEFIFTGSNATFTAPVHVKDGTLVLAHATSEGSVITVDAIGSGALSISGASTAPGDFATVKVEEDGVLANRLTSPAANVGGLLEIGLGTVGITPVAVTLHNATNNADYAGRVSVSEGATLMIHGAVTRNLGAASLLSLDDAKFVLQAAPDATAPTVGTPNDVLLNVATALAIGAGGAEFEVAQYNRLQVTSGSFSGTGVLEKTGLGTLALSANTMPAFTGAINVTEGVLEVRSANNLNAAASAALTLGGAATTGALRITGADASLARPVLIEQAGGIIDTEGGRLTLTGTLRDAGTLNHSDPANPVVLRKIGPSALTFDGAATRDFGGKILIAEGTLSFTVTAANALANVHTLEVGLGGSALTSVNVTSVSQQTFKNLILQKDANFRMTGSIGTVSRDLAISAGGSALISGNLTDVRNLNVLADAKFEIRSGDPASNPVNRSVRLDGDAVFAAGSTLALDAERSLVAMGDITFTDGAGTPTTVFITSHRDTNEYVAIEATHIVATQNDATVFDVRFGLPTHESSVPVAPTLDRFLDVQWNILPGLRLVGGMDVPSEQLIVRSELLWKGITLDADTGNYNAHGNFALASEQTFRLGETTSTSVMLADRGTGAFVGETWTDGLSEGIGDWDGKTLSTEGAGTLELATKNTYSGGSIIRGDATLRLLHANAGGEIDAAGTGAITFDGSSGGAQTLELDAPSVVSAVFTNAVTDINGAAGSIVKLNSGTVAIASNIASAANVHVKAGTLALKGADGAIAHSALLTVDSGAKFGIADSTRGFAADLGGALPGTAPSASGFVDAPAQGAFVPQLATAAANTIAPELLLGAKTLATGGGEFHGNITGAGGALVKVSAGTLTLSGANTFSGGTYLYEGAIAADSAGALGTGALVFAAHTGGAADRVLGISGGVALPNAIQVATGGDSTNAINVGAVSTATLTHFNALQSAAAATPTDTVLRKTGAGTLRITEASALDLYHGSVAIDAGTLEISAATVATPFTGTGTLRIALPSTDSILTFTDSAEGTAAGTFTGTVVLPRGRVTLDNTGSKNAAFLATATLQLGNRATAVVTNEHDRHLEGLTFDGGTLEFSANPIAPGAMLHVGTLNVGSTGGQLHIRGLVDAALSGVGIATALPDPEQNIFDYSSTDGRQILSADTVVGAGNLALLEAGLTPAANAEQLRPVTGGVAKFNYFAKVLNGGSVDENGIFLTYGLAEIAANPGGNVQLNATSAFSPRLTAKLTGDGGFDISGASVVTVIPLGNSASDYKGGTIIRAATVLMLTDNAFGALAPLALRSGAVLDASGGTGIDARALKFTTFDGDAGTRLLTATAAGADNSLTVYSGTFAGALEGGTSLTKIANPANPAADNALILSGANLHTGATTVLAGTLDIRNSAALAASSGLTLDAPLAGRAAPRLILSAAPAGSPVLVRNLDTAAGTSVSLGLRTLQIGDNALPFHNGGGAVAGVISGAGGLIKEGTDALTLSGANTFTGGVAFNGGDLTLASATAAGSGDLTHASAGTLWLGNGLDFGNNLLIHEASERIVALAPGASATLSGDIRKANSGWQPDASAFALASGTLTLSSPTAFDGFGGGVRIVTDATLVITAPALANPLTGGGTLRVQLPLASVNFDFAPAVGTAFTGTLQLASGTLALTPQNVLPLGGATLQLDTNGTGIVDAASTATVSKLILNGGTLAFPSAGLTAAGALFATNIDITAGATLKIDLSSPHEIGSVSVGGGLFDLWSGSTLGSVRLVSSTLGVTTGLPAGELPANLLLQDYNGRSILGPSATVEARSRELLDGGVRVGEALFLYDLNLGESNEAIQLGRTLLRISADAGKTVRLDASDSLDARMDAVLRGAGAFAFSGANGQPVTIGNGDSDYTGATYLSGADFSLASARALGATSALSLASGATLDLAGQSLTVGALNSGDATTEIRLGVSGSSLTVAGGGTFAGALYGAGGLTKGGAAGTTLTLSGASPFTGAVLLTGGTLRIEGAGLLGAPSTLATAGASAGNITLSGAGSRIVFAQTGAQTLSGVISGQGTLEISGPGGVTLAGRSNSQAATLVLGGSLSISDPLNLGSGANLLDGGMLRLDGIAGTNFDNAWTLGAGAGGNFIATDNAATLTGNLTGAGGFEKRGAGELTLQNANTYSGSTTVTQGTLRFLSDAAIGSGALVFNGGAVQLDGLAYSRDWIVTAAGGTLLNEEHVIYGGTVTGAGVLEKRGAGLFEVNGHVSVPLRVLAGSVGGEGFLEAPMFAPGSIISPGGAGGSFGVLTLGRPGETVALNGVILQLDLSGESAATPQCDKIVILGNAEFGTSISNILDLSVSGEETGRWWGNDTHVILETGGTLETGDLTGTLFRYRGVNLGDTGNSRLAATLEKGADGRSLVLTTYASASDVLDWVGGDLTYWGPGGTGWDGDHGASTFKNGDLVCFGPTGGASKQVTVTEFNNGVIVGAMDVEGTYVFKGGKIVGAATATSGGGLTADGWLRVSPTGDATFENEVDYEGIEVKAGGIVEFHNTAVAHNPVILNGTLTLAGDPVRGTTGALDAPAVLNNGALILGAGDTALHADISGTGSVTKNGSGVAVLSGDNTFTGALLVNGGTLAIPADSAAGGASSRVLDGGTLRLDGAEYATAWTLGAGGGTIEIPAARVVESEGGETVTIGGRATFSGTIAPEGAAPGAAFAKTGSGALVLAGGLQAGSLDVLAGAFEVAASGVLGSLTDGTAVFTSPVTIATGAKLTFEQDVPQRLENTVSGGGTLAINGGGLTLAGAALTHEVGAFNVGGGAAVVEGTVAAGSLTVSAGAFSGETVRLTGAGLDNSASFTAGAVETTAVRNAATATAHVASVTVAPGGAFINTGTFTADGAIEGGASFENTVSTASVRAQSVNLPAGSVANSGQLRTGSVNASGGITNAEGGALIVALAESGAPTTGNAIADGALTYGALSTAGSLANSGVLAAGAVTAAGGVQNAGVFSAQSLAATGAAPVTNSGALSVTGNIAAATVQNNANGFLGAVSITGNLENAASAFASVGSVTGRVTTEGALSVSGGITGDTVVGETGTLEFTGENTTHAVGGSLANSGIVSIAKFGSVLSVAGNLGNAPVGGHAIWEVAVDFADLVLRNAEGKVMDFANPDTAGTSHIRLAAAGVIEGEHVIRVAAVKNASAARRDTKIPLIVGGVTDDSARIRAAATVEAGIYKFAILDSHGAILECAGLSTLADASLNTIGHLSQGWFSQLDNLAQRHEEHRALGSALAESKGDAAAAKAATALAARNNNDSLWLRAYTTRLDTTLDISVQGIPGAKIADASLSQTAADAGYDHTFALGGSGATLATGVFAGYQSTRLRMSGSAARGDIDSATVGIYASYYAPGGWFADATVKAQNFDAKYKSAADRADFTSNAAGLSLGGGKRFDLGSGWFAEALARADYAHHFADGHTTAQGCRVALEDSDLFRLGAHLRAGKTYRFVTAGDLELSARFGLEQQETAGGQVRYTAEDAYTPNTDGFRARLGASLLYRPAPSHSLSLSYQALLGSHYTSPLTLSFAYQFRF